MIITKIDELWIENFYQKFLSDISIESMHDNFSLSGGETSFNYKALCCVDICEEHYKVGVITYDELIDYCVKIKEVIKDKKQALLIKK